MQAKFKVLFIFLFVLASSTINAQLDINGIEIGEQCPNVKLKKILNFPKSEARISDFKGKLLILDFWATWCSPCLAFMHRVDSLQKKFNDQLLILPVTYQDEDVVSSFLRKMKSVKGLLPPTVVADSILNALFPHNTLPHEVWIDQNGVVKAITSMAEVNQENVGSFLSKNEIVLPEKKDDVKIKINPRMPVLTGNQNVKINSEELVFHSIVTKFKKGFISQSAQTKSYLFALNHTIKGLYQIAFSRRDPSLSAASRIILNVKDSSMFTYLGPTASTIDQKMLANWMLTNTYCYEVNIGDSILYPKIYEIMQKDLNNYFGQFGINGRMVRKKVECWVLTRTSTYDKLRTKGGSPAQDISAFGINLRNKKLSAFMQELQVHSLQRSQFPIIDGTDYNQNVDMEMTCNLSDIESINKELQKYDLKFIKENREIEMILVEQK